MGSLDFYAYYPQVTGAVLRESGETFVTDYLVWPGSAPEFTLTLNNTDKTVTPKDGENELTLIANQKHTLTFTITATEIQVTARVRIGLQEAMEQEAFNRVFAFLKKTGR